jgi:hypothetical protein
MFFRSIRGAALLATLCVVVVGALSYWFGATHPLTAHGSSHQQSPAATQQPLASGVVITSHLNFTQAPQPPYGEFVASAVVCPSGAFVDAPQVLPNGGDDGRVVLVIETYTCKDGSGAFTIQFISHQPALASGPDTWMVISGTGRYAKLEGSGTMVFVQTSDSTATVTETGTMYYKL